VGLHHPPARTLGADGGECYEMCCELCMELGSGNTMQKCDDIMTDWCIYNVVTEGHCKFQCLTTHASSVWLSLQHYMQQLI
jgi:hypothetical protein